MICGRRGGSSFIDVLRPPSDEEVNCPDGTAPCSTFTSKENTVCYPTADHVASCPITEMFVADANFNDTAYTILTFREDDFDQRHLVYSKNLSDNLPLTTFKLDGK